MRLATQNRILFRLYRFVKHHAKRCLPAARRDDIINDVLLDALGLLRRDMWSIPHGELGAYAKRAVETHEPYDARYQGARDPESVKELAALMRLWIAEELPLREQEMQRAIEIVYAMQSPRRVRVHRLLREGGLSYLEVARELGMSIDAVQKAATAVQRALQKVLARTDLLPESPEQRRLTVAPPALCAPAGDHKDRAKWAQRDGTPWRWTPPAWAERSRSGQ